MPAVSKTRRAKHNETPYTRQKKVSKQSNDENEFVAANTLIETAAKGLYRLVSWVFTSGEDLSKNLGASASKVVHREQPERSTTSQLEDGIWKEKGPRSDSMLAPDLVPHYLGKTPVAVKVRRDGHLHSKNAVSAFRVPSFDAAQFKIPSLPTPPGKEKRGERPGPPKGLSGKSRDSGLKSLQIDASTQAKHDAGSKQWLSTHNLTPQDLVDSNISGDLVIDDHQKLRTIMADSGFFRRQGLLPPVVSNSSVRGRKQARSTNDNESRRQRSTSHNSLMSLDKQGSEQSNIDMRSQKINSREWQTNTSTGILAAWRDICEKQESKAQNNSLTVDRGRVMEPGAASRAGTSRDPMLWSEEISFASKKPADVLEPVFESDTKASDADERYWAPIRSFPMPASQAASQERDKEMKAMASLLSNERRHTRTHSRQSSLAKRPRSKRVEEHHNRVSSGRDSRAHTPGSVNSTKASQSRRPTNASRSVSRTRRRSTEPEGVTEKPRMVNSQVQTGDELMSFLADEQPQKLLTESPSISKERRKRPGCFSALDEDMEDLFGPYTDNPPKRNKMEDEDETISRPKVPLLKEDEAVKKLRAQQQRERVSMPPPATTNITSKEISIRPLDDNSGTKNIITGTRSEADSTSEAPSTNGFTFSPMTVPSQAPLQAPTSVDRDSSSTNSSQQSSTNIKTTAEVPEALVPAKQQSFPTFDFGHTPKQPVTAETFGFGAKAPQFSFGKVKESVSPPGNSSDSASFTFGTKAKSVDAVETLTAPLTTASEPASIGAPANIESPKTTTTTITHLGNDMHNGERKASDESAKNSVNASKSTKPSNFMASNEMRGSSTTGFSFGVGKQPAISFGTSSQAATGYSEVPVAAPVFSFGEPKVKSDSTTSHFDSNTPQGQSKPVSVSSPFSFGATNATETEDAPNGSLAGAPQKPFVFGSTASQNSIIPKVDLGSSTTSKINDATPSFVFGNASGKNDAPTLKQKEAPSFSFGAHAHSSKPDGDTKTAPPFNFASQPQVPGVKEPRTSTPVFSFGAQEQFVKPKESITFGQQFPNAHSASSIPSATNTAFGSTPTPGSTTGFSFNSAGFNAAAAAAPSQSSNASTAFGQHNTGVSAPPFGAAPTTQNNNSVFGGQPATSANPTFTFGSSNSSALPSTSNNFGSSAPPSFGTTPPNNIFNFGAAQSNPSQPSSTSTSTGFQFSAASQNTAQPFAFGQAQTAPNSGFTSPALQSPSLATANAPGSPNPFDFGGAGSNAAGTANTPRKVLQPRSRRPRNAR